MPSSLPLLHTASESTPSPFSSQLARLTVATFAHAHNSLIAFEQSVSDFISPLLGSACDDLAQLDQEVLSVSEAICNIADSLLPKRSHNRRPRRDFYNDGHLRHLCNLALPGTELLAGPAFKSTTLTSPAQKTSCRLLGSLILRHLVAPKCKNPPYYSNSNHQSPYFTHIP